jgi:uncharacterized protein YoxC
VSGGEIAGLIAAGAFLLLVLVLAVPLLKLGRTFDAATDALTDVTAQALPILAQAQTTMGEVNQTMSGVNHQLDKVDTVTDHVASVSGNVSTLAGLFTATLGGPLVKVAALSYGVRQAVAHRREAEMMRETRGGRGRRSRHGRLRRRG